MGASSAMLELEPLAQAAQVFYGALHGIIAMQGSFEMDQQVLEGANSRLNKAVSAGEASAAQLADWKAEGEALGFDDLMVFTMGARAEPEALPVMGHCR